jgi:dienelactone hydrolase
MKKAFRIAGITLLSIIGLVLVGVGVVAICATNTSQKFDQNTEITAEQTVENETFEAVFYPSSTKDRAVIVVSGSDGGIAYARKVAEVLAGNGISSLALAYWGTGRTPKTLSLIPVETVQSAANWLTEQGYSKVGIYGFSKGAEYALTAASLLPQIKFVVAVVPVSHVFEGIAKPNYSGTSSWTWQNQPLPYISFNGEATIEADRIWANREFGFRQRYLDALTGQKSEENTIRVENINGPVLLLSAKEDAQWPSDVMGEMIRQRLEEKQFPFPFHHRIYDPASHVLIPVNTMLKFMYKQERRHPAECNHARREALELSLQWILDEV